MAHVNTSEIWTRQAQKTQDVSWNIDGVAANLEEHQNHSQRRRRIRSFKNTGRWRRLFSHQEEEIQVSGGWFYSKCSSSKKIAFVVIWDFHAFSETWNTVRTASCAGRHWIKFWPVTTASKTEFACVSRGCSFFRLFALKSKSGHKAREHFFRRATTWQRMILFQDIQVAICLFFRCV